MAAFRPTLPKKDIRHLQEDQKIFDLYYWEEVLQEEGDGGKVVVCRPKEAADTTSFNYVMKIRSKASLAKYQAEDQFREAQLRMLNFPPHAGVIPLSEVLEDESFYYIIMEKAEGGSLFSSLLDDFTDGNMPEQAVKRVMRGILEAVGHVHKQGMLHRDIKPDNLVMQVRDDIDSPTGKAKHVALIDFDHADPAWDPSTPTWTNGFCGTIRFSAPEAFLGCYSESSDLYSVGVILYLLKTGKMPYQDEIYNAEMRRNQCSPTRNFWREHIHKLMKDTKIDWNCSPWPEQPVCKDFCQRLLAFQAEDRLCSADESLAHEWFSS